MFRKPNAPRKASPEDIATANFSGASYQLWSHPMFSTLYENGCVVRNAGSVCPADGWAVVTSNGEIHVHPKRRAETHEWVYVLAHCLLHLGFGHFQEKEHPREWNAACDAFVAKFLADLKFGRPPETLKPAGIFTAASEDKLYRQFCEGGIPPGLAGLGTAGPHQNDMVIQPVRRRYARITNDWPRYFGIGLSAAVTSAVNVAAGLEPHLGASSRRLTPARQARDWFISSYPLLGALAAAFEIVEDPILCRRLDISVAAVDVHGKEIFINPAAGLDEHECRFVMAHEMLHVGLRHAMRRENRDPYLWNVACDYVINGWLREMELGDMPVIGGLYDPELRGLSAETIYDRIATDLRRYRKLCTFRGFGTSDILENGTPEWWRRGDGVTLDEWYRQCLSQGLTYHQGEGRGLLPAGLIEEIRALEVPPIGWDVQLAQWFDRHFPPQEKVRTYARASRRQSATPHIARPRWVPAPDSEAGRTFGVVLDTSGSMDRAILAKALGAIASYSLARDVPAARVVFCDAEAYDQGYMPPEAIAESVRVRGRGGTVLQPGIDLLESAEDFPRRGPLLIITDGFCDRVRVHREHAFLLPAGHTLPFIPKGEVFRIK